MKKRFYFTTVLVCLFICATAQEQTIRVFSHRGGRMEHDENTMSAFQASYDAGYRGFETDIRMTKDGDMVITHDTSLERTTNGAGTVEQKTAAEIRQLDTKGGHKMLFLDELLDWLKDKQGLYVEFELKTTPVETYPQPVLEAYCDKLYKKVMANKPADAIYLFTSGDYRGLRYLQQKYGCENLLLITGKPCNEETIDLCLAMGIKRLGATMSGSSRTAVQKAHEKGLIVSLWPGQSTADLVYGAYVGADFLCTDIPLEYMKFHKEQMPWLKIVY